MRKVTTLTTLRSRHQHARILLLPDAATDHPAPLEGDNPAKEATYAMRDKTLKILETKSRLKKKVMFAKLTGGGSDLEGTVGVMFFEIGDKEPKHDALSRLLAAGVRAQQKRKAAGSEAQATSRGARAGWEHGESRVNSGDEAPVTMRVPKSIAASMIPQSIHAMSTRRSSKLGGFEALG
ncbi:hypothetical protein LshimejAT787_0310270 [Lyophyllum shimeji]|uniref:Uncharacterized protein n=1 Tax=Lyophyllum shimeji TaxID=47721 RepID=A0A9P3PIU0_LYOSH|nr:hypothetical protein LshimejAT787_0310270 [Lyophyllum shimeji]